MISIKHSLCDKSIGSKSGFTVLPKDTLACGLNQQGIEPPPIWLVNDLHKVQFQKYMNFSFQAFFYFYVFMIETCFEVSLSCKAGIFTKWTEVQWVVLQHHRGGYEALSHEAHVWHPCSIFSAFTSQQSNHSDFESAPAAHQLTPPSPVSCFPCWLAHWQLATLLLWWSLVSFHFHHGEDDINKTRLFMTGDSSPSPAARHTRLQSRHQPQYKKVELERIRRMTEQQESTSIISFQT